MPTSLLMSPTPSFSLAPCPCRRVNLRWNSCRPRRMERNGSRLMMYTDEPAVITSPRPAPISSSRDLLSPALAVFGACVLSIICACAANPASSTPATAKLCIFPKGPMPSSSSGVSISVRLRRRPIAFEVSQSCVLIRQVFVSAGLQVPSSEDHDDPRELRTRRPGLLRLYLEYRKPKGKDDRRYNYFG